VADYLRLQYPNAPYHIDFGSGAVLNKFQAIRQKRLNASGWPDVFIAVPMSGFHGLFLELKREGSTVWLRNGKLSRNRHIQAQEAVLQSLRNQGYRAEFAIGYEQASNFICDYLTNKRAT
jgi:hypothetical protein